MKSSLIAIPSESENKEMEKLFLAIFFNDIEKVIEFKNQHPKIYAKKECFLIDESTTFDLTYLTFFNDVLWNSGDWKEDIMPFIKRNKKRTE